MDLTTKTTFFYTTGPVVVGAAIGAVAAGVITIGSDADFQAVHITGTVLQAAVVVLNWGGSIAIQDDASGRALANAAVPFMALVGNGAQPYPLDPPRLFRKGNTITVTFVNTAAVATTVQVCFLGNKLYPQGLEVS